MPRGVPKNKEAKKAAATIAAGHSPKKDGSNNKVHIVSVRAKNIKCIREATIDVSGAITEIKGDAGQGKSAWLRAMEAAFTGIDPALIRQGEDNAEIVLEMDQAKIERAIMPGKEDLKVFDADGAKMTMAQAKAFLKSLYSPEVFDPLEWALLADGPKSGATERLRKQRDMLLNAIPMRWNGPGDWDIPTELAGAYDSLDRSDLDSDAHALLVAQQLGKIAFTQRKGYNSEVDQRQHEADVAQKPQDEPPGFPLEACEEQAELAKAAYYEAQAVANSQREIEVRIAGIQAQFKDFPTNTRTKDELQTAFAALDEEKESREHNIKDLQREIDDQRERIEGMDDRYRAVQEEKDNRNQLDSLERSVASLRDSMDEDAEGKKDAKQAEMESTAAGYAARKQLDEYDGAQAKLKEAQAKAAPLDALVKYFRDELPKKLTEQMEIPIPGMTIDEDSILIDGIPIHQLGTSQMIPIGVKIAALRNPKCGFLCIDRAESLGVEDRKILAATAEEEGLNLVLTIVDPGAEPSEGVIVMEKGEPK